MDYFERLRETVKRTSAPHYNRPVPVHAVLQRLDDAVALGLSLDRMKRALFYVSITNGNQPDSMPNLSEKEILLLYGIVGVIGEAAELAVVAIDLLKGAEIDRINAIEEVGDITWYADLILQSVDATYPEALDANDKKLKARYKDKFNYSERLESTGEAEREAMQSVISERE
jgi:hypothetical protein